MMYFNIFRFPILAAALVVAWIGVSFAGDSVPVLVGGETDYDACGSSGIVTGLDPNGDGFLSVRSGPGSSYAKTDQLTNGQSVYFCDVQNNWFGIVYSHKKGADCQVSSPIASRRVYRGPCTSGWAHKKYLKVTAG